MQEERAAQRHNNELGSVARVVRILDVVGAAELGLGVSEIARRAEISKSSAQRICGELAENGLLERQGTRYRLGLRLFELGQRVPRRRDLRDAAVPYMSDLREATGHSVHLAVLDGPSVVYLDVLRSPLAPPLPTRAGGRWPAHGTGVGKAILAFSPSGVVDEILAGGLKRLSERTITNPGLFRSELARIRERGVSYDLEESRPGVVCVASPVVGGDGEVVAGISVSGWHNRINLDQAAAAVRTAALGLSRQLADH
ncbi:IclR family transcriptional regulator [Gordonia rhizosphera]|uniref:Putative IclR family transcriptional regulator n=1 Tax=Gordonia rhizosphera NBRC 16068 TaxID=1108045 RepID=K6WAC2_9ACTN|nr:IclR family transcriptional regulator [Gordonia rhizosphera]GAB90701.1 putative IclR family transcriptional regulator [Gordonia rhizosphera NBRC 16068]